MHLNPFLGNNLFILFCGKPKQIFVCKQLCDDPFIKRKENIYLNCELVFRGGDKTLIRQQSRIADAIFRIARTRDGSFHFHTVKVAKAAGCATVKVFLQELDRLRRNGLVRFELETPAIYYEV